MGFTAGVLLGVVFFDVFPEILERIKENNADPAKVMSVLVIGFFLYIGASDILPQAHSKKSSYQLIGLTILGTVLIFLITRLG